MSGRCDECGELNKELLCPACCEVCKTKAKDILEICEWRTGKRRVFWRGYRMGSPVAAREFVRLDDAREWINGQEDYGKGSAKLYRVTVRPKVKL